MTSSWPRTVVTNSEPGEAGRYLCGHNLREYTTAIATRIDFWQNEPNSENRGRGSLTRLLPVSELRLLGPCVVQARNVVFPRTVARQPM